VELVNRHHPEVLAAAPWHADEAANGGANAEELDSRHR
jgi:hypothetical protein